MAWWFLAKPAEDLKFLCGRTVLRTVRRYFELRIVTLSFDRYRD